MSEATSSDYGNGDGESQRRGEHRFFRRCLQGKSGIRRITQFDPSDIPVQIAGEVPDFDELAWVEKRERKHVSRVLPLALAAATEALLTAGIDAASLPSKRNGASA